MLLFKKDIYIYIYMFIWYSIRQLWARLFAINKAFEVRIVAFLKWISDIQKILKIWYSKACKIKWILSSLFWFYCWNKNQKKRRRRKKLLLSNFQTKKKMYRLERIYPWSFETKCVKHIDIETPEVFHWLVYLIGIK